MSVRSLSTGGINLRLAGVGDAPAVASVKLVSVVEPSSSGSLASTGPTFSMTFYSAFFERALCSRPSKVGGLV